MPTRDTPPIQRSYDLAGLSEAGDEVAIVAKASDLLRLAEWAGVDSMERFEGVVTLRRLSPSRFLYEAVLNADVVQSCIVSLQPVRSRLERRFLRILQLVPRGHRHESEEEKGGILTLAAGDDDAPEEIESSRYDLTGPLLEELSLGIDPYPRAPGVEFTPPPATGEEGKSPFAVLKRMKKGGSQ